MDCETTQALLSAYVDDELSVTECQLVEEHTKQCPNCQRLYDELRVFSASVANLMGELTAPSRLEERVIQVILDGNQAAQTRRLSYVYLACTALALIGLIGLFISPLGFMVRMLIHLGSATFHGVFMVSYSMGHVGLLILVIWCLLFGGVAMVGLFRMLRSLRTEVVI